MREINIGLLGCGTVGTGVAKLLIENKELLTARVGANLILKRVADIDIETDRGIHIPDGVLVDDAYKVVGDPEIDIVIEMIGGEGVAKDLIERAIENGKHVVTANKALLAVHGDRLFAAAAQKGVDLAFEASVGGCMPIVKTIRESLVANRIKAMTGILNGTCNYILSKIADEGITFQEALTEAQRQGYAEADPTLDVEGFDTAHKIAILTALAYGMEINLNDVYIEGISRISPLDIEFAEQFGYRIKLLAISKFEDGRMESRVHPTMIPADHLLASIRGTVNAITVSADATDDIMLYGRGAGMMPTASAVLSDIVDLSRNIMYGSFRRVPALSYRRENMRKIQVLPIDELVTHYYFRFSAIDRPGVLAAISGIIGQYGISLQSVHQKGRKTNGAVPLVMLSHLAREADVKRALTEINALDVVSDEAMLIRIENEELD